MRRKAKGEKRGGESKREAKWKGGVERKGGSGRGGEGCVMAVRGDGRSSVEKRAKFRLLAPL